MVKKKTEENPVEEDTQTKKKLSQAEYEKEVLKLADEGLTSEKIGETLRGRGIHPKEYSKKISQILGNKYINPDLKNVEKKLAKIKVHAENNPQDKKAKREKDRVFSQLRRVNLYLAKKAR
jgi:ribosomal protein S15P/S13E